jgi:hypothetical protein
MNKTDTRMEDQQYGWDDWKYEVRNGDTRLGYWEWVEHKVECARGCACEELRLWN